ncbi:MAG: histidinol-phosphate transaminase, partial [Actinomycetales bacterium]
APTLPDVHRYPDYASTDLVRAIAERFNVPDDHVAVGTGSVGMLQQLFQITCGPGDGVVFAWRSFEAYPIMAQIVGASARRVELDDQDRHDLDAMADAIDESTRLVLVCNPNNPTGTAVDEGAMSRFIDRVPADVLVVVDEAYCEFVDPVRVPDGLRFYREHSNVAVLRTFSKAYGLAALRVGFCIAPAQVADALRKVQVPFGVSTLAQVAGIAALQNEGALMERVLSIREQRDALDGGLRALGLHPADSQANFLWLRLGERANDFASACQDAGLSVRPFENEGVRITVGEPDANAALIEVARAWALADSR